MSDAPNHFEGNSSRIDPAGQVLYRGTTKGWPGNSELQKLRITCTSTDPLVATLFAIECRNHGQAVVLIASREPFLRMPVPENWFSIIESAVNVGVSPEDFAATALYSLNVDRAIAILQRLGFPRLPVRIPGKKALQDELEESHRNGQRLSLEQIDQFNLLVNEVIQ